MGEVNFTNSYASESQLPQTRLSLLVSRALEMVASLISIVWVLLLGIIVVNVTARYIFGEGRIEFEEAQWHLYSIGFLFGLSVCFDTNDHIRVDVIHDKLSLRAQAWIELYGLLLLFFPFVTLVLVFSIPFAHYSFSIGEISSAPGGLPHRWIIKSTLFAGFALLAMAGLSRLSRVSACLFGHPRAVSDP